MSPQPITKAGPRKAKLPKLTFDEASGRHIVYFRKPNGVPCRKRFSSDLRTAQKEYIRWLAKTRGETVDLPFEEEPAVATSIAAIAIAYDNFNQARRRADDDPRKRGTICTAECHAISKQTLKILDWAESHFGSEKVRNVPFGQLWEAQDFDDMMAQFTREYGNSQINKHWRRFWKLARFATRRPYRQQLSFTEEEVGRYGGKDDREEWSFPTPEEFRAMLHKADTRMRAWIWMAVGLGFGQGDISKCGPPCFDAESYDLRRGKTRVERWGTMRPMVWAWISKYLDETPRPPEDYMFVTRNGLPFTRRETKTKEELEFGTTTRGPKPIPYKHTDGIGNKFRALRTKSKVKWNDGFYIMRHIAGTAVANRPGFALGDLVSFMGHARMDELRKYVKPLSPRIKQTIQWVNLMLDLSDPMAWDQEPAKVLQNAKKAGSPASASEASSGDQSGGSKQG